MTIFKCDSCQQQKPCTKLRVDDMRYDVCDDCREKFTGLQNGEPIFEPQPQPIIIPTYPWPPYEPVAPCNPWQPQITWGSGTQVC